MMLKTYLFDGVLYGGGAIGATVLGNIQGVNPGLLTPSILLGIGVLLLLTGKIVHVSALDRERANTKIWMEAYQNEAKARSDSERQSSALLQYAKDTDAFIKSFVATQQSSGG